jgi:hypothetical protein
MNRETWLNEMANLMAPRFEELGHPLPPFYVSVGFPAAGKDGRAAAECWHSSASADKRFQIHIRPDEADSMMISGHLAHELAHAAVGFECGHQGAFARVVMALGLKRPLTSTVVGEEFKEWAQPFIDKLGKIPHASLRWTNARGQQRGEGEDGPSLGEESDGESSTGPKKQSARLLKAMCAECGYTVRITRKWLEVGRPPCPLHGAMDVEGEED